MYNTESSDSDSSSISSKSYSSDDMNDETNNEQFVSSDNEQANKSSNDECIDLNTTCIAEYLRSVDEVQLDFKSTPRINVFMPWLSNIPILEDNTASDLFKSYILGIASGLQMQKLQYKEKLVLAEAISKKESYLAGYKNLSFQVKC